MAHRAQMKRSGIAVIAAMLPLSGFAQSERPAASENGQAALVSTIEEIGRLQTSLVKVLQSADGREALNLVRSSPIFGGAGNRTLPASCQDTINGLTGAFTAVVFALNAPVKGKGLGEMTGDELRFSTEMRPSREWLEEAYKSGISTYRANVQACFELGGVVLTKLSMPDQLPSSQ
ncbi:hypothetical protein QO058_21145 [Bosea vestrisii]|uniref:hypothetical protein n=1 Tax=Bosea vestrisii TaxID=151416 RepID=UPI0024DF70D8|nr:hypothetical protein [Bosea vestrisii]WID95269.1 hypothetical protein QO058_21145 [Bosea vestrisii]